MRHKIEKTLLYVHYRTPNASAKISGITLDVNGNQEELFYGRYREEVNGQEHLYIFDDLDDEQIKSVKTAEVMTIELSENAIITYSSVCIDAVPVSASITFKKTDKDILWLDYEKPEGTYDIALIEKPDEEGLTKQEMDSLYDLLLHSEAYPLEIGNINGSSTAMGLINRQAADDLLFEYDQDSELGKFISTILNDVNLESKDGSYSFKGLNIWIGKDALEDDVA